MSENRYASFFYGKGRPSDRVIEVRRPDHDSDKGVNSAWVADPGHLVLWFDSIRYVTDIAGGSVAATDFPDQRAIVAIRQLITFLIQDPSIRVYWRV